MVEPEEKGLENLDAWQKAMKLAIRICTEVLVKLPREEKWCLMDQLRRSAQSIPANIAEGYGRYYYPESIRFCYIGRGSLEETRTHLALAYKLGYLSEPFYLEIVQECRSLLQVLNGYIAYLKRSKRGANEPGIHIQIREVQSEYEFASFDDDRSNELRSNEERIENDYEQ